MIHTNRIVTVGEQECIIDRPIVLYRGDREVEIEFTLVGNEFMFSEEGNVIKSVNASHGQLVLNTPSGEHMFSELAECHEGKVVFVVTKEMIDEFIEMGFYSFQIRLYDSAEMKSRVTIPPVMNGFDIRNPIAAEDETNVVDQGIVDYARIFKDQSNEELPTFTWDGEYVKTEWAHHDVITENKMNKIEDALYSINANVKESDVVMLNALDNVKKDADKYVKEHMAEVEAEVDEFERNLNTGVEKFKVDTNAAMTAHKNEVSEELEVLDERVIRNTNKLEGLINIMSYKCSNENCKGGCGGVKGDGVHDDTSGIKKAIQENLNMYFPANNYIVSEGLIFDKPYVNLKGDGIGRTFITFKPSGSDSKLMMFLKDFVKIEGIEFTYSGNRSDGRNNTGLYFKEEGSTTSFIDISDCRFTKFSGSAIAMYACISSTLRGLSVSTCNNGILAGEGVSHGTTLFLENSYIQACLGHGVLINRIQDFNLTNVIIETSNIGLECYSCRGVVINSYFEDNVTHDIYSKDTNGVLIYSRYDKEIVQEWSGTAFDRRLWTILNRYDATVGYLNIKNRIQSNLPLPVSTRQEIPTFTSTSSTTYNLNLGPVKSSRVVKVTTICSNPNLNGSARYCYIENLIFMGTYSQGTHMSEQIASVGTFATTSVVNIDNEIVLQLVTKTLSGSASFIVETLQGNHVNAFIEENE